jgi:hypothetical protein
MDAFMPPKIAKRRAYFPNAIVPPNSEKPRVIALIKTMAVITDQILNQASAFEAIDLCCYFIRH